MSCSAIVANEWTLNVCRRSWSLGPWQLRDTPAVFKIFLNHSSMLSRLQVLPHKLTKKWSLEDFIIGSRCLHFRYSFRTSDKEVEKGIRRSLPFLLSRTMSTLSSRWISRSFRDKASLIRNPVEYNNLMSAGRIIIGESILFF